MGSIQDSSSGKTLLGHLVAITETTLEPCLKKSDKVIFQCLESGGCGVARLPLCDIAWRVLDAQYWGVPQRRRRIFLVADFATTERRAAEILLVEKRLSGDSQESSSKEQGSSNGTRTGTQGAVNVKTYSVQAFGHVIENDKASALKARDYKGATSFIGYTAERN